MRIHGITLDSCCSTNLSLVAAVSVVLAILVVAWTGARAAEDRRWLSLDGGSIEGSYPETTIGRWNLDTVLIDVKVPGVFVETRETAKGLFQLAEVPGEDWLRAPGKPMVPEIVLLVACPEFDEVEVHCNVKESRRLNNHVPYPSPREVLREGPGSDYVSEEFCLDDNVYSKDSWYPATLVDVLHVGRIRDQKVIWLGIHPVRYNGAQKELVICSELEIELGYVNPMVSPAMLGTGPFEEISRRLIVG